MSTNLTLSKAARNVYADAFAITAQQGFQNEIQRLGQRHVFDDGREFVFCSTAVDLAAGQIVAAYSLTTDLTNILTAASAGATQLTADCTGLDILGAGSGVMTKDLLAGGYITIGNGTGEGYTYRIKGNSADDSDDKFTIDLFDPLKVAVAATTDIFLSKALHSLVIVGTASLVPIGVAVVPSTAATAGVTQYLWVQTKGPAATKVTTNTTIALGKRVACGASGGCVISGTGLNDIGIAMGTPTANGDFIPVMLQL